MMSMSQKFVTEGFNLIKENTFFVINAQMRLYYSITFLPDFVLHASSKVNISLNAMNVA